ncbi:MULTISPECIES: UvrD-helicase domain-containing protein [Prosthecochloris]|uniref:DNA 3'-5' helicase n=1 Tax=Prosthecochloris vibrioformis TaxID=1098 RepID=A0A5C4S2X3_PROVB|nr:MULTISPECIES: UvrD-helicase domain-containing protein [Prosthecochloris]ANT65867.1 DNA-dependent helicase II [Prosthecochloris sp. CIB 2401]TNJ37764.1 DNA helicase [Prosthecochloris vibrioformis]
MSSLQLTSEQLAVVSSHGNIVINAVAGSGKTATLVAYAASRPCGSSILYLAFNRAVRYEAVRRFASVGLGNVDVETPHSLAYRHVVRKGGGRIAAHGYGTAEVAACLGLGEGRKKQQEYLLASHAAKFASYFCSSACRKVAELDYLDVVGDPEARRFVAKHYRVIEQLARRFLAMMEQGRIGMTHDFYLKKFQLSEPVLDYDYLLFDEGQDASRAMLDVFARQRGVRVIVGDTHQQIYGWRHAVNSLEVLDYPRYALTSSFRFGQEIAGVALSVLEWKRHLGASSKAAITGAGGGRGDGSRAVLARSNLGLLGEAIRHVSGSGKPGALYFEGNLSSYTFASEGASLYDVLNLRQGNRERIRDRLVYGMRDLDELAGYVEKSGDSELGMMVRLVREYGRRLPGLLREIRRCHADSRDPGGIDKVYSTVHRAKGMEYDEVRLVDDFLAESDLLRLAPKAAKARGGSGLLEEVNLLYVAVTRARVRIMLPRHLLPQSVACSHAVGIVTGGS